MITGLNHLTLAVRDVERSFRFYVHTLGLKPLARWRQGAYLTAGDLWLCLSLDNATSPSADYTHYAFSVPQADFASRVARLRQADVHEWKSNRSEGESFYFLDPDGHRLELHAGDLASRLAACRRHPYQDMTFFEDGEKADG